MTEDETEVYTKYAGVHIDNDWKSRPACVAYKRKCTHVPVVSATA